MTGLPPEIWWPLGALVVSAGAFGIALYLAWERQDEPVGNKFAWAAQVLVYGLLLSVVALVVGIWIWARPR